jgi:hypothetical protein
MANGERVDDLPKLGIVILLDHPPFGKEVGLTSPRLAIVPSQLWWWPAPLAVAATGQKQLADQRHMRLRCS